MNIDRSRFLLLTAALSATACVTSNSNPDGGTSTTTGDSGTDATTGGVDSGQVTNDAGDTGTSTDAGTDSTATCDDSVGDLSACAPFEEGGSGTVDAGDGGPNCFTEAASQICAALPNVKPKIGKDVIDCTMADPTCESIQPCILTALGGACPDSTAATTCNPLVAMCNEGGVDGGVSLADCTKYVSALSDDGRTAFSACMEEGFHCDMLSCLGQLF